VITDPDQPAFPEVHIHHFDVEGQSVVVPRWNGGLTKREYIAIELTKAILTCNAILNWRDPVNMPAIKTQVENAFDITDRFIERLNKFKSTPQEGINNE